MGESTSIIIMVLWLLALFLEERATVFVVVFAAAAGRVCLNLLGILSREDPPPLIGPFLLLLLLFINAILSPVVIPLIGPVCLYVCMYVCRYLVRMYVYGLDKGSNEYESQELKR